MDIYFIRVQFGLTNVQKCGFHLSLGLPFVYSSEYVNDVFR